VVRRLREQRDNAAASPYLVLLTARHDFDSLAEGLGNGADDYLAKPFDRRELRARLKVGERIMRLEHERVHRISELEEALARVKTLQGLLPVCAWCRRVRDDGDYWKKLEEYVDQHTALQFSHGICPDCLTSRLEPELQETR
jgi:response regulator RpfG family c-di-GMP phosphodiesterase